MKVLIVEDEAPAVEHLQRLLARYDEPISILESVDSVRSTVRWLLENEEPELIFMDIQLADGLSFEIFNQVSIDCPVIFTTAYDQYALKAFEVNSIDYLLKPVNELHLKRALKKLEGLVQPTSLDKQMLNALLSANTKKYKEQFILRIGDHLKKVMTNETLLFYSEDRSTYLCTLDGKRYLLDLSLEGVEEVVNPNDFFRVNRKYLVSMRGIEDMIHFSSSRMKLTIQGFDADDVIVAREKVAKFKKWLDR